MSPRNWGEKTAVIVVKAAGGEEILSYRRISEDSSRFAHWLVAKGVAPGDRVAIKLEPSRAFYAAVFGAMKAGAIAVPLFTLFGPDGVKLRVEDCKPKLLDRATTRFLEGSSTRLLRRPSSRNTRADDLAIFQYTSGTTRELPEAVKHTHRAIVTVMVAALYGTGLRPGDRFFCPSSPAWGHGLWHGTLAPLALGLTIGCYAGKFDARAAAAGAGGAPLHQHLRRGHALPHDGELGRGVEASLLPREDSPSPASRSTARPRPSSRRPSVGRCAACTARPRSA